jgi:hypothetical protein
LLLHADGICGSTHLWFEHCLLKKKRFAPC